MRRLSVMISMKKSNGRQQRHVHVPEKNPYNVPAIATPATVLTPRKENTEMLRTKMPGMIKLNEPKRSAKKLGTSLPRTLAPFTIDS